MKFTNSKAAELFWVFGRNEGTDKKIKNQSSKEYWKERNHESERVIIANADWVTRLFEIIRRQVVY